MIRLLLYSDEPVLARGFASVISAEPDFELISIATSMAGLISRMTSDQPDVVVMDLTSEITFGALAEMKAAMQQSKVVLWVHNISTELAFQAMGVGVRGILRKTLNPDVVIKSLRRVHEGELWFEKSLTDSFLSAKRVSLTRREGQLVTLLAQGLKNKEIATMLLISEGTVKVYLSRLFQKLGVKDRFELALYGLKNLTTGQGGLSSAERGADMPQVHGLRSLVMERPVPKVQPQMAPFVVNRPQGVRQNFR